MGSDDAIVQAARVSYGKGTKKVQEDRGLIRYLMRHSHTTPFEMCEIKFHIRVPMDCWRQWIRHRTANVNEYSTRYSVAINAMMRTGPDEWRAQATSGRQGGEGKIDEVIGRHLCERQDTLQRFAQEVYNERLSSGVAREQARKDLPLATYTEAYWKIDLHNLLHFLELRMDRHAQLEIRLYANVIGKEIVARWVPLAWEAFQDYRLSAMSFSRIDQDLLRFIVAGHQAAAIEMAKSVGWLQNAKGGGYLRNHECEDFEAKLLSLGLKVPWNERLDPSIR
jgi:thymidylate synthase (FAD)